MNDKNQTTDRTQFGTVYVRRSPQDLFFKSAVYNLDDVTGLHWSCVGGGFTSVFNDFYICGYVDPHAALEGELPHRCAGEDTCTKTLKVAIIRKYTDKKTYAALLEKVGKKP